MSTHKNSSSSASPDKITAQDVHLVKRVSDEVAVALHDSLVALGELSAWLCTHYRPGDGSLEVRRTAYFAIEDARALIKSNTAALEMLSAWMSEHCGSGDHTARMLSAAQRAIAKLRASMTMEP